MKLGVISRDSPDGREARLVAVEPAAGVVVDLRAAERIRLEPWRRDPGCRRAAG